MTRFSCPSCGCCLHQETGPCAGADLLFALKKTLEEALGWYDECRGGEPDEPWVAEARAAISKAEAEAA